jgi:CO/xanthine dehydrogenase FAD-binding subunit
MKTSRASVKAVDINRLPLNKIEDTSAGGLRLDVLCANAEIAYHVEVEKRCPLFSKTILAGASPQLMKRRAKPCSLNLPVAFRYFDISFR